MNNTAKDRYVNRSLIDEFIYRRSNNKTVGNVILNEKNYGTNKDISLVNKFLEAHEGQRQGEGQRAYTKINQGNMNKQQDTGKGTVREIESLYRIFKILDSNDRQNAGQDNGMSADLTEYIFEGIIDKLKTIIIYNGNKEGLYQVLSEMDSDNIFKHSYLQNHAFGKSVFDEMFEKLKISAGNNTYVSGNGNRRDRENRNKNYNSGGNKNTDSIGNGNGIGISIDDDEDKDRDRDRDRDIDKERQRRIKQMTGQYRIN